MHFSYGEKEIDYLKSRDKRLGAAIEKIGPIKRAVEPDLFSALIQSIVGQQVSVKAQQTVWGRIRQDLIFITPESIDHCSRDRLQGHGITFKKADYIKNAASKILSGELDVDALVNMPDGDVCRELSKLNGIGVWTAEMLMLHSMQRPDILSFGDLAILRGLRMIYHHRKVDKKLFDKYRRRYSPHASVASLYLWAIAGGAVDDMKDYAPQKTRKIK